MAFAVLAPARRPLFPRPKAGSSTTLTQASLTFQTARSLLPASHPTSRSRTGHRYQGPGISPDGLAPPGHRDLAPRHTCLLFLMTPEQSRRTQDQQQQPRRRDRPDCCIRRLREVEAVGRRSCWGLTSWTCNPRGATAARPDASTPYDKNDRTGRRPARTSTAQLGEDYRCAGGVEEPGRGRSPSFPGEWTGTASAGLDRDRRPHVAPPEPPGGLDPGDAQAQPAPGSRSLTSMTSWTT